MSVEGTAGALIGSVISTAAELDQLLLALLGIAVALGFTSLVVRWFRGA